MDIAFDTIWCPVCSRQILPKRLYIPINPPSPQLQNTNPLAPPPSPTSCKSPYIPFISYRHRHSLISAQLQNHKDLQMLLLPLPPPPTLPLGYTAQRRAPSELVQAEASYTEQAVSSPTAPSGAPHPPRPTHLRRPSPLPPPPLLPLLPPAQQRPSDTRPSSTSPRSHFTAPTSAGSSTCRARSWRSRTAFPSASPRSLRRHPRSRLHRIIASRTARCRTRATRAAGRPSIRRVPHIRLPSRSSSSSRIAPKGPRPRSTRRRHPRSRQSPSTAMQCSQRSTTSRPCPPVRPPRPKSPRRRRSRTTTNRGPS